MSTHAASLASTHCTTWQKNFTSTIIQFPNELQPHSSQQCLVSQRRFLHMAYLHKHDDGVGGANGQTGGVDSALKLAKQATKGYNSGVRGQSKPFCLFAIL